MFQRLFFDLGVTGWNKNETCLVVVKRATRRWRRRDISSIFLKRDFIGLHNTIITDHGFLQEHLYLESAVIKVAFCLHYGQAAITSTMCSVDYQVADFTKIRLCKDVIDMLYIRKLEQVNL